jgi:hypothetical protein
VPVAVICTEPFRATARAIAEVRGQPDYPFIVIEHPIGNLTEEELRDRGAMAARRVAALFAS